jgi:hypothetical protein
LSQSFPQSGNDCNEFGNVAAPQRPLGPEEVVEEQASRVLDRGGAAGVEQLDGGGPTLVRLGWDHGPLVGGISAGPAVAACQSAGMEHTRGVR